MRIIVWGINYAPEPTGIAPFNTELCEFLAARGHAVEMVSTFPYYPAWEKRASDAGLLYAVERVNGVALHRCWHYVPRRVTALKRMIHEASFIATSFWKLLWLRRPDVFVVVSPPLALGFAAWILSRLKRAPFVFHVQDLQPDAAVGTGMLKRGFLTRVLYGLEALAYKKAGAVSGICQGMLAAFIAKGVPRSKTWLSPNWIRSQSERASADAAKNWRAKNGFSATSCLLIYSGNLGMKQGLSVLLDAAQRLAATEETGEIRWVIAGDGAGRAALVAEAKRRELSNLAFLPLQSDADFAAMLAAADACVITQLKGTGQFFFPSKLLSAAAHGRPVIAVGDADSELSRAVEEGQFGLVAEAEDVDGVVAAARVFANADLRARADWSESALRWAGRFERDVLLSEFLLRLERLARVRA